MIPGTRRRAQSQSDTTDHSQSSAGKELHKGKRARAESVGNISLQPNNTKEGKKKKTLSVKTKGSDATERVIREQTPTMDVVVHRMRCLNFQPKSILAMKATPPWSKHTLLALSRENGYVEVKCVDEKLRTVGFLAGYRKKPVTSLAWVRKESDDTPLLLGASRDGSIFYANFGSQAFTNITASGGGGVFALESLSSVPGCESYVTAACEDGSVRIFQYQKVGGLLLISTIPSCGAPVLTLAWRKRDLGEMGLNGLTMFVAVADGTIRRFDCSRQNERLVWKSLNRMTVESRGRNVPTRVWALKALKDGTLVSANSLGQVQFWDGETGSLQQSMEQTRTKADVLSLAVSADESKVFASGVDSRVVCVERRLGPEPSAWMLTQSHRGHTHDVKSLEICWSKSTTTQPTEHLFSGGVDTRICSYRIKDFAFGRPGIVKPWPTSPPFFVASKARLLGVMREQKVELFRLADKQEVSGPVIVADKETPVGTVEIRHASNLVCADLNSKGNYLAVANMLSLYIFSLSFGKKVGLRTKRIPVAAKLNSPVSAIKFTNDNTLALSCIDGCVFTTTLPEEGTDESQTVNQTRRTSKTKGFPTNRIVNSLSGSLVATLTNTLEGGGIIEVFSVEEDGFIRPIWTLPPLNSSISDVSFVDENRLAVACVDYSLTLFDVGEQRLNRWNQEAGTSPKLPHELELRADFPVRIVSHSANKVIMVSFGMFIVFDLDQPFPTTCKSFPNTGFRGKKKRKRSQSGSSASLCSLYRSMMYLDFVDEAEMVVVEQPWVNISATLPPALARRVYGT